MTSNLDTQLKELDDAVESAVAKARAAIQAGVAASIATCTMAEQAEAAAKQVQILKERVLSFTNQDKKYNAFTQSSISTTSGACVTRLFASTVDGGRVPLFHSSAVDQTGEPVQDPSNYAGLYHIHLHVQLSLTALAVSRSIPTANKLPLAVIIVDSASLSPSSSSSPALTESWLSVYLKIPKGSCSQGDAALLQLLTAMLSQVDITVYPRIQLWGDCHFDDYGFLKKTLKMLSDGVGYQGWSDDWQALTARRFTPFFEDEDFLFVLKRSTTTNSTNDAAPTPE